MKPAKLTNVLPLDFARHSQVLKTAQRVLEIESKAVAGLIDRLGAEFEKAVDIILRSKGRVIVTGVGKSGIIAKKIASTLSSTGTSAFFMHPADGAHGDLGMVLKDDVIICISKSGNSDEISRLIPILKRIGVSIITLTGNLRSALSVKSDVVLDVSVEEEACPNDLAPTASTTATLALGDALAVALLEKREFQPEDFAFLHPGGSLGKILLKIDDVMFSGEKIPRVRPQAPVNEVILEISRKRFGGTCVVDERDTLLGIITDGDLRRYMSQSQSFFELKASQLMHRDPKTVVVGSLAVEALRLMENHNILQIVVVDEENHPAGMVHLHDLLEAGLKQ
ncbi:D-arabinose 5-phosphate isomerase [candidate division KSB1 bacterium RBG_16_48_16]|nr:MAG: D-arabinose 5-phosphate isomerase [candidate division KSB1 bacterium RBG_16_48_16]